MLNKHISRFNEIKGSIKVGFLDAFSIAYIPVKSIMETRNGQEVRRLEKLNLLNVAFTGNPVNTEAKMINVFAKSLEFLKEQEKARSIEERRTAGRNESLRESETEDAEDEDKKKNKKKEEGKNHIHESDQLNTQEVKKMSEEETIAMKEENASEKAEKPKPKKEEDDDEEMMMKKKKNSQKSEELSEIKSELESVKKELMEVKAAIIKPVLKSRIEQQDKSQNFVESKSISPLDMIA
jgi:chemotaxis protein histidine kinase CheA